MHGSAGLTRITIDFSGAVDPAHGWIIGRPPDGGGRVELLAFADRPGDEAWPAQPMPTAADGAACTCPDFCERDHANE